MKWFYEVMYKHLRALPPRPFADDEITELHAGTVVVALRSG